MQPHGVIVPLPPFNDDLCFAQHIEQYPVEQLIPELAVEGLKIAVLPWDQGVRVLEITPFFFLPLLFS